MAELSTRLRQLARTQTLLVATDYDGTLAPIVSDPKLARPLRESMVALRALAELPDTHVAVISGRSLDELHAMGNFPPEVHLVGSHGSEFDLGFGHQLDATTAARRDEIRRVVQRRAKALPGSMAEIKPTGAAFHFRNATPGPTADAVLEDLRDALAAIGGVSTITGKMVLEASAVKLDKGAALRRLRQTLGATAVLFTGDDVTDELAFAVMGGDDVAVKVGPGTTIAASHLEDPHDIARMLAELTELRSAALFGAPAASIDHHSFISNQQAHALIDPAARIVWYCHPRIDAGAVFAEILGGPSAGYFSVAPARAAAPLSQRYLDGSLIVETRWSDLRVVDYLDWPDQDAAAALLRVVHGTEPVRIEFAPRLDYARTATGLERTKHGLRVSGALEPLILHSPGLEWEITWDGNHQSAHAVVTPPPDGIVLELSGVGISKREPEARRRVRTVERWDGWLDALTLPDRYRDEVAHSASVLAGLCHPSGAFLAAASCSLPSDFGGFRNWDYRYCWPRDSALAMLALVELDRYDEALSFLAWLEEVMEGVPSATMLRPVYALDGRDVPTEAEIASLRGYAGSRPVRIGNAAEHQVQFDAFGAVAELVHGLIVRGAPGADRFLPILDRLVEVIAARWQEPDHGIWEVRVAPRHHTHSKTMCWAAVNCTIGVYEHLGREVEPRVLQLREDIRAEVYDRGYDADAGFFTAWFGGFEPDAATLHVGLSGMVAADDLRFTGTIAAVEDQLRRGPTVLRYRYEDGLPGHDGGFHLCTSWLVDAYLLCGRVGDAVELFESMLGTAGPTGLFAEGWEPSARVALGNFPQAYSHLGVIRNAVRINRVLAG